jgi:hypothetical protein
MKKSIIRTVPMLLGFALLATACNLPILAGSDEGGDAPVTAVTDSPPVEVETAVATTEPVDSTDDSCLQGQWVMNLESLQILMATLLPLPNFHIQEGSMAMSFSGENYTYASENFVLRMDTKPGEYFEGAATFTAVGTYTTANGEIIFNNTTNTQNITSWRSFINGEYTEVPGGAPQISFGFPGSGPYTCNGDSLTVGTAGTANTPVPMVFTRVP